jgi:arylamine N-acetyltransferase
LTPELLESVLDALDLSRAEPGIGLLEALFSRFNARVPFETASKIERDARIADRASKPRRPEIFWNEHLESGAGGTCFARVAAFGDLLAALGFSARKRLGRVVQDFDHAGLVVTAGGRSWICDVGFPLPALVPEQPGDLETGLGALHVAASERGWRVAQGGVPEGPRALELFAADVPEPEFERRWQETFRPASKFLTEVSLRHSLENRAVSFARGELRVDDAHTRLTLPLAAPRARRLSGIFGVDEELLQSAFDRVGDPDPAESSATLAGYLEAPGDAADALAVISSAAGYRRLLEGVAETVSEESEPGGFLVRVRAPGAPEGEGTLEDRGRFDAASRRLEISRRAPGAASESSYQLLERDGRTYLARALRLPGPREELLRNDSMRGRLAGSVAADLLGWARAIRTR